MKVDVVEEEYDLVGLGFGPANLSLSIALRESAEAQEAGLRFHFFEKQPAFGWHSSLLLPGAQLQVSPMKDLATMRDPTSSYTFTNYLHKQGRLAAFINREASIPSRREWSAYLHWAARRMDDVVSYGKEVVSVEPVKEDEGQETQRVRRLRLRMRDRQSGEEFTCFAKNITVAVGGVPVTPEPFEALLHPQATYVAHSSSYLPALASMEARLRAKEAKCLARLASQSIEPSPLLSTSQQRQKNAPLRFAVVGSGQSAAEISLHLRKTFPTSHVSLIFRASALVPSDDSAFVNAMAFDPDRTDAFWKAGHDERMEWMKEFKRTNYSVVRNDVLNDLHTEMYDQDVELTQPWPNADGPSRYGNLQIRPNTQVDVASVVPGNEESGNEEQIALTMRDLKYPMAKGLTPEERTETFDAAFLATGFRRGPDAIKFLEPLEKHYPRLDRDATRTRAALGFGKEVDSFDVLASMNEDQAFCERLRHRTRGITRDYRLVSYSSDAFTQRLPFNASTALPATPIAVQQALESGASTPRRGSDMSDSDTLADNEDGTLHYSIHSLTEEEHDAGATHASASYAHRRPLSDEERRLRGPIMEPGIYFLGGNEATHGLSDSLLSIVAHRAGELTASILRRSPKTQKGGRRTEKGAKTLAGLREQASFDGTLKKYQQRNTSPNKPSYISSLLADSMGSLRTAE